MEEKATYRRIAVLTNHYQAGSQWKKRRRIAVLTFPLFVDCLTSSSSDDEPEDDEEEARARLSVFFGVAWEKFAGFFGVVACFTGLVI
jgi:hypothetical protein